eukprot:scaffold2830_cov131-Cylindrotheca_fusiformis.AAC.86
MSRKGTLPEGHMAISGAKDTVGEGMVRGQGKKSHEKASGTAQQGKPTTSFQRRRLVDIDGRISEQVNRETKGGQGESVEEKTMLSTSQQILPSTTIYANQTTRIVWIFKYLWHGPLERAIWMAAMYCTILYIRLGYST